MHRQIKMGKTYKKGLLYMEYLDILMKKII